MRFFLAKQRHCTCLAQTFREEAEGIGSANSGVGGAIFGLVWVAVSQGTSDFGADTGAGVAAIGGREGGSALMGLAFVGTLGSVGVGRYAAGAVSDQDPEK
ncbi:MAG: hypothetical protein IT281_10780 [Ignavibacteria bacterium]|nr:hypothetical protein [Ignavibacteria bacterium]